MFGKPDQETKQNDTDRDGLFGIVGEVQGDRPANIGLDEDGDIDEPVVELFGSIFSNQPLCF